MCADCLAINQHVDIYLCYENKCGETVLLDDMYNILFLIWSLIHSKQTRRFVEALSLINREQYIMVYR